MVYIMAVQASSRGNMKTDILPIVSCKTLGIFCKVLHHEVKVKLSLCLINLAQRREDV
jgi:hypothetical protein